MPDGSRSAVRAQAVELSERVMFSALFPLGATIAAPDGFEFEAMTPDAIVGEMNIAIAGEWLGHPAGPFAMDADKMQQCVDRFAQQANPMMVDYEHNSLGGMDGRASGWIHRLTVKGSGEGAELWATVEWTARAADMIRAGEYRYCSPVIDFGGKDRESGEHVPVELFNVAITNQPFLDGMHPIALSRVAAAVVPPPKDEEEGDEGKDESAEQAPPKGEQPPAEGEGETEGDEESEGEGEGEGEQKPPPDTRPGLGAALLDALSKISGGSEAAVLDALDKLTDEIGGRVRDLLETTDGSASDAQEIAMTDKIETQSTVADAATTENKDEVLLALAREVGALRAELAEEKKSRVEAKQKSDEDAAAALSQANTARIDAMMGDGRLKETEREPAQRLLNSNAVLFEEIYGKREPGTASPVTRRQVAAGDKDGQRGHRVAASRTSMPAKDEDVDVESALEQMSEAEKKAFHAMVALRKDPKATARRILSAQVRDGVRLTAQRVGYQLPE